MDPETLSRRKLLYGVLIAGGITGLGVATVEETRQAGQDGPNGGTWYGTRGYGDDGFGQ